MNMITVLLGATGVLLAVAIALSFGSMKTGTKGADLEKLRQEIADLKASQLLASQASLAPVSGSLPPPAPAVIFNPAPDPGFPSSPIDADLADADETAASSEALLAEEELRVAEELAAEELAAENERLKKQNKILKNEIGIAWQPKIVADAKHMARANTIKEAMILARVTQWDETNGFAVIEILEPDAVQSGYTLAIRRQTGIYGQIKVGQMYPGGQAIADPDPSTFLGEDGIDVQPGDELILPPH